MTSEDQTWDEFQHLVFGVKVSIKYHDYLQGHYKFWANVIASVFIVVGGLIVAFGGGNDYITNAGLFVLSSTSALLSILKLRDNYHLHLSLRKQFQKLDTWLKNVEVQDRITPEVIVEGNSRRADIEIDEPTMLRVLSILCHNETVISLGYQHGRYYEIPTAQRLFCKFRDIGKFDDFKVTNPPILSQETS